LRDELDRMKAAATPEAAAANLTADADFRTVRGQLGSDQQIVTYMDVRAVATAAYDFLVPLGQLNPRGRPANVNLDLLPTSVALARHLGGIAIGVHTDAAGIKLESYSATGFWSTLAPVAALAIQAAQRAGRQARGALAVAGETAEQAQRRQQLRDTYRFLNAYAQDHQGQYPVKLADLMPNYVKPEAAQKVPEITYLGRQDAPNKVLAHMNPAKPGDPSPVLLQDGHVHMVAADQLDLVLKEGFKEEAAPPAGGATKPPVPPPDF